MSGKPRLTVTYSGTNIQGYRVFTCMINGCLRTFRTMGYDKRTAMQQARAHFNRVQQEAA
jgi:hypothetical protein